MEKIRGKSLQEWKKYCEKDNVPIKTIKYITCLEERIETLSTQNVEHQRELLKDFLEHIESTIDYLPCEPSVLIDNYFREI